MIGNDIVDLELARSESNWKRRGFLDKLFTENEKACIRNAENQELAVWGLWSRKEAVYKIYNRLTGICAFMPSKIECLADGLVFCAGNIYHTQTQVTPDFIHSVAVLQQSNLTEITYLERNHIVKHCGIPFSKNGNPASVSHHGNFERIVTIDNYNPNFALSLRNSNPSV